MGHPSTKAGLRAIKCVVHENCLFIPWHLRSNQSEQHCSQVPGFMSYIRDPELQSIAFSKPPPDARSSKVSNVDQLSFSRSAMIALETSSSSLSFRLSELSQSIWSFLLLVP
jgi:hypothetical protein